MNKVFEVHFGYMCGGIVLLLHIIIGFYLLYVLQIDLGKLEIPTGQKVVWYTPPAVKSEPIVPENTAYIPPTQQDSLPAAPAASAAPTAAYAPELPTAPSVVTARTAAQRRASWSKVTSAEPISTQTDMGRIIQEINQEQAQQRAAQAVYTTKNEQVKARAAAQMLELMEERLRRKVTDAITIICHENTIPYHMERAVRTSILFTLVISQEGEILAVEVLRSTGTKSLDDYLAMLLKKIKKITVPPRKQFTGVYTMTIESGVTGEAGTYYPEFTHRDGKSPIHIV